MYLQEKDKMVFSDSTSISVRRDLHGVLLLDTALQTPVTRPEDVIKLELPLAEVIYSTLDKLLFGVFTQLKFRKKQFRINLWDKYPIISKFCSH